ncbi:autotransporter-associated beta strand repeat-containing protein [Polynucleobacter necessarius]|uniref:autotransporter-associated beta strand repeat-containing protein n=1 Tax=Polynucleobacter necessarius TaxID=576610 RepID=UPI000E08D726|nr:autotransporter-associated beta strand repeat-containing protein [Polynucleobacter necessarius]
MIIGSSGGSITSTTGVLTGSSYTFNNTSDATISAILAGSVNLTQAGSGTTTLSGTNTYTGTTTLTGGTLSISTDAQLGAAPLGASPESIVFNGGTLNNTASFTLNANRGVAMTGDGIINVNDLTMLTYNGLIAGPGDLTKSGAGTLILGGMNTYTGLTNVLAGTLTVAGSLADTSAITVASGATYNVASADTVSTVLGSGAINLGANLTVGYGDNNFVFSGSFAGAGSLIKIGSGSMTLAGNSSTYTGNTILNSSSLVLNNANALGLSTVISSGGYLQLADGIVLSRLHVTGPVTITSHIMTTGDQIYDGAVSIVPAAGLIIDIVNYDNQSISPAGVELSASNGNITLNSTIDAVNAKSASLKISATSGAVVIGDSVGSITPLENLYVVGQSIRLLADVLTGQEQTYVGATTIGSNGSAGFLYSEFVRKTRPATTFAIQDPLYTRTFISMDPTVRFVGNVNPDTTGIYSLVLAAIYDGFVNGDPAKEPRIIVDGLVGNLNPFYSINFQTLRAGDLFMLAGKISAMGVKTIAAQNYSTDAMTVSLDSVNSVATFRSSRPGTISFDLSMVDGQMNMGSATGVTRVIIDGLTNLTGRGVGLAAVGFPVQETAAVAAAAAAAGGGNLTATAQFGKQFVMNRDLSDASSVSVVMDENIQDPGSDNNQLKKALNCREELDSPECG